MDWRKAKLSHLALWRRTVAASPVSKTNGHSGFRSERTVGLWMVAVRSFYEWADAHSLLATDVVSRMTELKYFAPGTAGGGEHGAKRRVLVEELRSKRIEAPTRSRSGRWSRIVVIISVPTVPVPHWITRYTVGP
jgi:integrase/recombinase XerD